MAVINTGHSLQTPVGEKLVGRMLDVFGHPLDKKGPLEFVEQRPLLRHPLPLDRRTAESGLFFRFIQAGSEVSGLLGRLPSRVGYQPTMSTELAELEERISNSARGSITSLQAVYVPADDFTDPSAVHIFSH